jgi:hypothetical protein
MFKKVRLSITALNADVMSVNYAECPYAECLYAECRGAICNTKAAQLPLTVGQLFVIK